MPDIFLSYSRGDQATARQFAEAFEREGLAVWWDQTLRSGENYDQVTETALREAKAVVVLWSKHSVDSRWVRAEATQADRNGTLVPVMIEPCNRPIMFELKHSAELAHWRGDAADPVWRAFLRDVTQFVKKEGAETSPPAVQTASSPPMQFGVRTLMGIAALLLIVGGVLWLAHQTPRISPKQTEATTAATSAGATKEVTLAVLPFANISTDPQQEPFCDGLTEEILNQLAQIKDFAVTGRTSSFSFKGKNEDLRSIAQKLGVANLLEGSIRKDGKQLRITAQLINGKSGTHMWSRTYARESKDIFTVQEEIAKDVAQALSVKLDVGESNRSKGGTTNVDAYERYLQARGILLYGGDQANTKATRLLREAVALDPEFSRAWLDLGSSLFFASPASSPIEAASLRKEADAATERGMTLAPNSPAAQSIRMVQLVGQRQWSEADAWSRKVVANPAESGRIANEVTAPLPLFLSTGRYKELAVILKEQVQLEPLSPFISLNLQIILTALGEYRAAQSEYERSRTLPGSHAPENFRALLRLLYQGATPLAVQEEYRRQNQGKGPGPGVSPLKDVIETLGDHEAALAILRKALENPANQNQAQLTTIYQLADALGDKTVALAALHRMITELNQTGAIWFAPHSGMRSDPKFKEILKETGLTDYFRASGNWGDFCKPVGKDDFECR